MNWTAQEIATLTQCELRGDPDSVVTGISGLEEASPTDASFIDNPKYEKALNTSLAKVVFTHPRNDYPQEKTFLVTDDPSGAFQSLVKKISTTEEDSGFTQIHPTAVIHPSAILGDNVTLGPYVVVDQRVRIGDHTRIDAHCTIGNDVTIGENTHLRPSVSILHHCHIGSRVLIQPGAVIGSCGFGFSPDAQGRHQKIEQLGNVVVGDDVEIGANSCIDRARFKSTTIAEGTKIDNLVQIGHNCSIGQHNILCGQSGIAGSTKTGRYVVLGGQCGVNGHIELCDGVMCGGNSAVMSSVKEPGKYLGTPAIPYRKQMRTIITVQTLEKTLKELKSRISEIEKTVAQ
jgi:UDP-3-O-[3-hydroxymyristoyl] glucosamine N-acyltransferase